MSFLDDVERSRGLDRRERRSPSPTSSPLDKLQKSLSSKMSRLVSRVSEFSTSVDTIGTPNDTPQFRESVEQSRGTVKELIEETNRLLGQFSNIEVEPHEEKRFRMVREKLKLDFQDVVVRWKEVLTLSLQRERVCVARERAERTQTSTREELDKERAAEERRSILKEEKRKEQLQVEDRLGYNEEVIQEREIAIQQIDSDIQDINEMFVDLGMLVKEQGTIIDNIESNVEVAVHKTEKASEELQKAQKYQRAVSKKLSHAQTCYVDALSTTVGTPCGADRSFACQEIKLCNSTNAEVIVAGGIYADDALFGCTRYVLDPSPFPFAGTHEDLVEMTSDVDVDTWFSCNLATVNSFGVHGFVFHKKFECEMDYVFSLYPSTGDYTYKYNVSNCLFKGDRTAHGNPFTIGFGDSGSGIPMFYGKNIQMNIVNSEFTYIRIYWMPNMLKSFDFFFDGNKVVNDDVWVLKEPIEHRGTSEIKDDCTPREGLYRYFIRNNQFVHDKDEYYSRIRVRVEGSACGYVPEVHFDQNNVQNFDTWLRTTSDLSQGQQSSKATKCVNGSSLDYNTFDLSWVDAGFGFSSISRNSFKSLFESRYVKIGGFPLEIPDDPDDERTWRSDMSKFDSTLVSTTIEDNYFIEVELLLKSSKEYSIGYSLVDQTFDLANRGKSPVQLSCVDCPHEIPSSVQDLDAPSMIIFDTCEFLNTLKKAISIEYAHTRIVDSVFENCKDDTNGGAISFTGYLGTDIDGDPEKSSSEVLDVERCTFTNVESYAKGGAIFVALASDITLTSNTFTNTSCGLGGGVLAVDLPIDAGVTMTSNSYASIRAGVSGGIVSSIPRDGEIVYGFFEEDVSKVTALHSGVYELYSVGMLHIQSCNYSDVASLDAPLGSFFFKTAPSEFAGGPLLRFVTGNSRFSFDEESLPNNFNTLYIWGGIGEVNNPFLTDNSFTIPCPLHKLYNRVERNFTTSRNSLSVQIMLCTACSEGQEYINEISSPLNSKTVFCRQCPPNVQCLNDGVYPMPGYAFVDPFASVVKAISCPEGYCCTSEDGDCKTASGCPDQRSGDLCSRCVDGYCTNLKLKCVDCEVCSPTSFIWTNIVVTGLFTCWVILNPGSSGPFKVVAYFLQIFPLVTASISRALKHFSFLTGGLSFLTSLVGLSFVDSGGSESCPFRGMTPSSTIAMRLLGPLLYFCWFFVLLSVVLCLSRPFYPFVWIFTFLKTVLMKEGFVLFKVVDQQRIKKKMKFWEKEGDGDVDVDGDGVEMREVNDADDDDDDDDKDDDDDDDNDDHKEKEKEKDTKDKENDISAPILNRPAIIGLVLQFVHSVLLQLRPWRLRWWHSHRFMLAFMTLLILAFKNVVEVSFRLITCKNYDDLGKRLYEDASVNCTTGWQYVVIFLSILFVYPAPIFIWITRFVIRFAHAGELVACYGPETRAVMEAFELPYKRTRKWWESVMIGRRLVLLGFTLIPNSYYRSILLAVGCALVLGSHVIIRPFSSALVQFYETVSLVLLLTIAILGVRESVESEGSVEVSDGSISLLVWVTFVCVLIMCFLVIFVYFAIMIVNMARAAYALIMLGVGPVIDMMQGKAKSKIDLAPIAKDGVAVVSSIK